MNKQQLANKIWESANKMRSKIEANEYKDYILGFIFYKFLSDKEVVYLKNHDWTDDDLPELVEEDTETVEDCKKNIGYFISYNNLFSSWLASGKSFDVSNVTDALSAFERNIDESYKRVFDKIFDTLQMGLNKLGETSGARTVAIRSLLKLIKDIPMDEKQGYDVLGYIYEYLISNFASNAGKKAGEFYTPHEVSLLMSELISQHLKDRTNISIYDPTSGSGSLLINIGKSVAKYMEKENVKYFAQELKENTYNLTRMNLVMRGIKPANIFTRNADTLEEDWPIDTEKYPPVLRVDAVVSNPPYSQSWIPDDKENDPRYSGYGLAPKSKADYAFLLHDLYHVTPEGIMTIVLPHGVLFRGGEEGDIRKNLIENNHIDAIIGLPANIFFGTGIPTIIMVLRQKRTNDDVLIIDASKGFVKEGKNNKLRACDIKKISDVVAGRLSIPKYSRAVERDEIRRNEYNLNIPRYIDSSEKTESYDIYASMFGGIPLKEISEMDSYWNFFKGLKESLFESINDGYVNLKSGEIKVTVNNHPSVEAFEKDFERAFDNFEDFLVKELIDNVETVPISSEEKKISDNIFERLSSIALIDKYEVYQQLDENWIIIESDLEIIKTDPEGFNATKKVDPKMVMKKDVEVQDGYVGRILPFELVQEYLLVNELTSLKKKENRLAEISSEYEELLSSMSEDEKESDAINEEGTAFVNAQVIKLSKQYMSEMKKGVFYNEESIENKILKCSKLIAEEKQLRKEVKEETEELQVKTKATIENLTDDQVKELLKRKWISKLISSIKTIPTKLINELILQINILANKYSETFEDIEKSIAETENELCSLMDSLRGNEFDMKGINEFKFLLKGK
ncbi:MAG: type I restriction-modification system subunit M [Succinivibrionaceae bacterium]